MREKEQLLEKLNVKYDMLFLQLLRDFIDINKEYLGDEYILKLFDLLLKYDNSRLMEYMKKMS